LRVSPQELERALKDLPSIGRRVSARGGGGKEVWRFELAGKPYYLSFYRNRGGRALREFSGLQVMQRAGVPSPRAVAHLSGLIAGRPAWLAASTHPGEEEFAIAAHRALARRHPNLLTVIAPRHPKRGPDVASLAARAGLRGARRAEGLSPDSAVDVYVADTIGEMGLFFRLTPLVLVGGTLVPIGGHNPIEPAKLGAAILHGPHVDKAREIYAALDAARGALTVTDEAELARALARLLDDPALVRATARAAMDCVNALGGAVDRTLQSIEPFIVQAKLGARH